MGTAEAVACEMEQADQMIATGSDEELLDFGDSTDDDSPQQDSDPDEGPETDHTRLMQRQKQIDYGKNTIGYERYLQAVPKHLRKRRGKACDPPTPDITKKMSKKTWDGVVRGWRRHLHKYDNMDEPTALAAAAALQQRLAEARAARQAAAAATAAPTAGPTEQQVHSTPDASMADAQQQQQHQQHRHGRGKEQRQGRDSAHQQHHSSGKPHSTAVAARGRGDVGERSSRGVHGGSSAGGCSGHRGGAAGGKERTHSGGVGWDDRGTRRGYHSSGGTWEREPGGGNGSRGSHRGHTGNLDHGSHSRDHGGSGGGSSRRYDDGSSRRYDDGSSKRYDGGSSDRYDGGRQRDRAAGGGSGGRELYAGSSWSSGGREHNGLERNADSNGSRYRAIQRYVVYEDRQPTARSSRHENSSSGSGAGRRGSTAHSPERRRGSDRGLGQQGHQGLGRGDKENCQAGRECHGGNKQGGSEAGSSGRRELFGRDSCAHDNTGQHHKSVADCAAAAVVAGSARYDCRSSGSKPSSGMAAARHGNGSDKQQQRQQHCSWADEVDAAEQGCGVPGWPGAGAAVPMEEGPDDSTPAAAGDGGGGGAAAAAGPSVPEAAAPMDEGAVSPPPAAAAAAGRPRTGSMTPAKRAAACMG